MHVQRFIEGNAVVAGYLSASRFSARFRVLEVSEIVARDFLLILLGPLVPTL